MHIHTHNSIRVCLYIILIWTLEFNSEESVSSFGKCVAEHLGLGKGDSKINVLRKTTEIAKLGGHEEVPKRQEGKGGRQYGKRLECTVKCPEICPHGVIVNRILTAANSTISTHDLHRMLRTIEFVMDKALNFKINLKGLIFFLHHWDNGEK